MKAQAGHTLVELMIATTVMAVLFATLASSSTFLHRSDRTASAYAEDLRQCRRALSRLEQDLQQARSVEAVEAGVRVLLPEATIDYTLRDGVLTRTAAGTAVVLARCIDTMTAVQDRSLVDLRLVLRQRSAHAARQAAIETTIYLRSAELPEGER